MFQSKQSHSYCREAKTVRSVRIQTNNLPLHRPITCPCTAHKIYTACIAEQICRHPDTNELLAEEQKGRIVTCQGCKEQLTIHSAVLQQAHEDNRNLYIAYSDCRETLDWVPLCWLIHVSPIYRTDTQIINWLRQLMKKWTTVLQVKVKNHQIMGDPIRIQRGKYRGEGVSALWLGLALNTLSYLLYRTKYGFWYTFW
jgi:hypothetical protein